MNRPTLLVSFCHDYAVRDLVDSLVLDNLGSEFNLCFVVTGDVTVDLSKYGPIIGMHRMPPGRMKLWSVAFGLRHLAGLEPLIRTQPNHLNVFHRGYNPQIKKMMGFLHRIGLSSRLSVILEAILAGSTPDFLTFKSMPDAALLTSGINDPCWDDTVTLCKRYRIPSLTLTINWDNIAHKIFLQQPDRLGVWGPQAYLFARLFQKIPADRIAMLGTPRFEFYRSHARPKGEARSEWSLGADQTVLLFAGSGVAFDEVSLIEEFERAAEDGRMPKNVVLLYKPHPKRHPRAAEPALSPHRYKRVTVVGQVGRLNHLSEYPELLSAVDGLVTPLSTMMLEGAIMGLPALGLGYDDPSHGDYSWDNARLNNHLHAFIHSKAHVPCHSKQDFIPGILKLLTLIRDPTVAAEARAVARFAVFEDGRPFSVRVAEILKEMILTESIASARRSAGGRLHPLPDAEAAQPCEICGAPS